MAKSLSTMSTFSAEIGRDLTKPEYERVYKDLQKSFLGRSVCVFARLANDVIRTYIDFKYFQIPTFVVDKLK